MQRDSVVVRIVRQLVADVVLPAAPPHSSHHGAHEQDESYYERLLAIGNPQAIDTADSAMKTLNATL